MGKPTEPLDNHKHELFAQAVSNGTTHAEAYRQAGYKPKTKGSADSGANKLFKMSSVKQRIKCLQQGEVDEKFDRGNLLSVIEKRQIYARIARNEETRPETRIKAMDADSNLVGDKAPDKSMVITGQMQAAQPGSPERSLQMQAAKQMLRDRIMAERSGNLKLLAEKTRKDMSQPPKPNVPRFKGSQGAAQEEGQEIAQ